MKNQTHIVVVLDRSGSMADMAGDVIGGYKTFVEKQKELGDNASMTLVQFDTHYETVFENMPIKYVSSKLDFQPRGGTALLDAMGRTIDSVGRTLAAKPERERPDKVIFVIITDGEENSSTQFNNAQIRERVERQQGQYQWEFLFLGANIDSFHTGGNLGISVYNTSNYAANGLGIASALRGAAVYTSSVRSFGASGQSMSACYNAAVKDEEAERGANTNFLVGGTTWPETFADKTGTFGASQVVATP